MPQLSTLDIVAIALYAASWIGYARLADHSRWHQHSIMFLMDRYRERWMRQMLCRDNRIIDSNIIGGLQNGAAFFASTTIFAVGGLIAVLGAGEQAVAILSTLPLVEAGTVETWRLKVLLLVLVMSYAFFKFAWTFRLHNYASVVLGAAPLIEQSDPGAEAEALKAARLAALASRHFNRGIRAYFFALAALAWFLHPALFISAILYVLVVLHRREFRSNSLKALKG